jgi:beta-lactamase superfamily II metal-dependent hydrolase
MAGFAIGLDLAGVTDEDGRLVTTLAWGDPVEVIEREQTRIKVGLTRYVTRSDGTIEPRPYVGYIKRPKTVRADKKLLVEPDASRVLKLDFVDVQQGDASVIETPSGRVVLIDGGDNQLFARYLANRFRGTSDAAPKEIDGIVVSHGDADHFSGLTEIHKSELNPNPQKRLFIHPKRVFHNGLVKRPTSVPDELQLGAIKKAGSEAIIVGLEDDLRAVADAEMNTPFRAWKRALTAFTNRGAVEIRRIEKGQDVFGFLGDGVEVEVLAPILTKRGNKEGLLFLGEPAKAPVVGHAKRRFGGKSVSHTINGHSIVLRLTFGNWRFLYAGDLNEQAEGILTDEHAAGRLDLEAEILKVPHHGSADFSGEFLRAVRPLVSVVSSGDENERKEYIHPRATLMSALGRHSREGSLVFVTELVAFFKAEGWIKPGPAREAADAAHPLSTWSKRTSPFYAFSRTAFGIVKVRCSPDRLLVYTNSGQSDMKEAYAFEWKDGGPVPTGILRT